MEQNNEGNRITVTLLHMS